MTRSNQARQSGARSNACGKTLFGSMKMGRLHGQRFRPRRQAMHEVIAWTLWYNRTRQPPTLACVSPMQFEKQAG